VYIKITFYAKDRNHRGLAAKKNSKAEVKLNTHLKNYNVEFTQVGYLHTIILEDFKLSLGDAYKNKMIKSRFINKGIRDLKIEYVDTYKPSIPISS
jgi:hypothetical protein